MWGLAGEGGQWLNARGKCLQDVPSAQKGDVGQANPLQKIRARSAISSAKARGNAS